MKQVKQLRTWKQRGFTLLELGISMSLIAVATTVAISRMSESQDSNRAQTVSRDLGRIINGIQRTYASQTVFPGEEPANITILANNNVFPETWLDPARIPVSPFGGVIRFGGQAWSEGTVGAVVLDQIPANICTQIGQMMALGLLGLEVNGEVVKEPRRSNSPFNVSALGTNCTTGANATMSFYFSLGR